MPRVVAERADTLALLADVFREHGYEGASLARISKATSLGKGSLYHFFPGGKEEMAEAVLAEINAWFEAAVFAPLEQNDAGCATDAMFDAVVSYFRSGSRTCLVGALALSDARDRFSYTVRGYFARWVDALAIALLRYGHNTTAARLRAEEVIGGIQGAIVLARALDDPAVFERTIEALRAQLNMIP